MGTRGTGIEACLDRLMRAGEGDAALWLHLGIAGGIPRVIDWAWAGARPVEETIAALVADPARIPNSFLESVRRPERADTRGFLERSACVSTFGRLFGTCDYLRVLVYDGDRFLGWVGTLRFDGGRPYGPSDRKALTPLLPEIADALRERERSRSAHGPRAGASLVLSASGAVEYACGEAAAWLARAGDAAKALARFARSAIGSEGEAVTAFAGLEARCTVLRGRRGARLLVRLAPAAPLVCADDVALSPVQREVALLAAAGDSIPSIAQRLSRAPETIRTHLREAYARLGVTSRVELAHRLGPRGESTAA